MTPYPPLAGGQGFTFNLIVILVIEYIDVRKFFLYKTPASYNPVPFLNKCLSHKFASPHQKGTHPNTHPL